MNPLQYISGFLSLNLNPSLLPEEPLLYLRSFFMQVFFLLLFFSANSLFATGQWQDSFLTALRLAQKQDKAIFLDLYTDWCGYCKILKKEVFPSRSVSRQLKNFIAVRLNGDAFPNLVAHYAVKGYPTILLLDKHGIVIDRIIGLPDSRLLAGRMKQALTKKNTESLLQSQLEKQPDNVALQFELAIYYYKTSQKTQAARHFTIIWQNTQAKEKLRHDSLFNLAVIQFEKQQYTEAIQSWSDYLQNFANHDLLSGYYYRGRSHLKMGHYQNARIDLQKALQLATDRRDKKEIHQLLQQIP